MEETLFRDEYGNLKDWAQYLLIICIVVFGMFIVTGFVTGLVVISDNYEVKAFNRIHGTDYTLGEWFWAQSTIKDYHLGKVQNINLNVKGIDFG